MWNARTQLSRAKIIRDGRKFICPGCGKQCLYRAIFEPTPGVRRCADCAGPLNSYATDDLTCGPCDEARMAKEDAKRKATAGVEAQEAERRQVLETLPASLPTICIVSGIRWVDVQRVLKAAVQAGDVVIWNQPGFRPLYRLVRPLPSPEEAKAKNNTAQKPYRGGNMPMVSADELLAALPATCSEMAKRFGYQDSNTVGQRMRRMQREGSVRRVSRALNDHGGFEYVWHRAS
jgi:hypothetical protein